MSLKQFKYKDYCIDYIISIGVFIQSFLVILQQVMIFVFGVESESTTKYRVLLSAIPMSIAIVLSFKRKPKLFIGTYFIITLIILWNIALFPNNVPYLEKDAIRFLLPMVIPSALCLMTVSNIKIVEKCMVHISWASLILILLFIVKFLTGTFLINKYSMAFSYGCLIPMTMLYKENKTIPLMMSIFILGVVLAIGSRGAAIVFFLYVIYDRLNYDKKNLFLFIFLLILSVFLLPVFVGWLDSIGLTSRTISLLTKGELIEHDSGRSVLYSKIIKMILENPLGLGLFADRHILNGTFCHNIILEILIDWGYIIGSIIVLILLIYLIGLFCKFQAINKNRLICYFLILIAPLFVSNSYLLSYNFGSFWGLIYLIIKNDKVIKANNYV